MTDQAIAELTPILGSVRAACKAAGRPQANHYRRHRQSPKPDKPVRERKAQPRALTQAERDTVRAVLNSPGFVDKAPASVYHELLDEGVHLCSPSTRYRILHSHNEVKERRRQAVHPARVKPELVATQPNQCWSWDTTKLHGPAKWSYYHLYVIIDIFSRYVVGWLLADAESKVLAEKLLADTIAKQDINRDQLTIHADNGSSMASKPVAFLLADLGVTKSHSRPHTSNDNLTASRSSEHSSTAPIFLTPSAPSQRPARSANSSSPGTTPSTTIPASLGCIPSTSTTDEPRRFALSAPRPSTPPTPATPNGSSTSPRNQQPSPPPPGSTNRPIRPKRTRRLSQ
jgi:transposase InsO family protein